MGHPLLQVCASREPAPRHHANRAEPSGHELSLAKEVSDCELHKATCGARPPYTRVAINPRAAPKHTPPVLRVAHPAKALARARGTTAQTTAGVRDGAASAPGRVRS